jgi:hypothetical protein
VAGALTKLRIQAALAEIVPGIVFARPPSPSSCPMANVKSRPKAKQKKKAPTGEKKREASEEAPSASVYQSAFSVGDWVHHPMFGDGKIKSIEVDKLTIKFEGNFTKEIREDFVTRKG